MARPKRKNNVDEIIESFSSLNIKRKNICEIHKNIKVSEEVIEALEIVSELSGISIGLVIEKLVNDSSFIAHIDELRQKKNSVNRGDNNAL